MDDYNNKKKNGYDSDGALGPFYDAVRSDMNKYDESIMSSEEREVVVPLPTQPIEPQPR